MKRTTWLLVVLTVGLAACSSGGGDKVVQFDPRRALSADAEQALGADSGASAFVPLGVSDHDLMSSVTTPWAGFTDKATEDEFARQQEAANGAARRYARARDAAKDGYVFASYFVPGFGVHWINWALVNKPFDPAHPAMLLYDGEGKDARLVALSYYVRSARAPQGFASANDRWHRHFGTCYAGGFLIGENVTSSDECTKRCTARADDAINAPVGTEDEIPEIDAYMRAHPDPPAPVAGCHLVPGNNLWMLHMWNVAGHENAQGLFSTMNPAVNTCAGACRDAPK